jgi:hypothetical protein
MSEGVTTRTTSVAVVGGGIFGCTTAIELAQAGHRVTLFEAADDIMQAASGINQYRLHRGYHYPRSSDTIRSCIQATPLFETEYADAVIGHLTHYYAIAESGSKVSGKEYLDVLARHDLPYTVVETPIVDPAMITITVRADERLYDPAKLRSIMHARLNQYAVDVRLNTRVDVDDLTEFDFVVVATYAHMNTALSERVAAHREYQYEVCEKIVVEIPEALKQTSIVVMDGPFMCFDPLGDTGFAVMGHVEHAVHHRSFGNSPVVPDILAPLLNKGIIENPPITNAAKFIDDAARYIPALKGARHVGSMYTIRTVLPKVDHTDERPTIVTQVDDRIFTIYSGKIGNSVKAARDVVARIDALTRPRVSP